MKDGFIKVAASPILNTVADCKKNAEQIILQIEKAAEQNVKLIVFPELCITGYTAHDLFLQKTLIDGAMEALFTIVKKTEKLDIISVIGLPLSHLSYLYNCAAVIYKGEILGFVPKSNLPNYSEFYEKRYFSAANEDNTTIEINGKSYNFGKKLIFKCKNKLNFAFGVEICEDLWVSSSPAITHCQNGANIIANLSAGNEVVGKSDYRRNLVAVQSAKNVCGYIYAAAGEGESTTDSYFCAHSIICENGTILKEAKLFENEMIITEIDVDKIDTEKIKTSDYYSKLDTEYKTILFDMPLSDTPLTRKVSASPFIPQKNKEKDECNFILNMQAHALKSRLVASHSNSVVVGISGGLDSTLALLACVKCFDLMKLDRKNIVAISMPCFGTTNRTKTNAEILSTKLGVTFKTIDIKKAVSVHFEDIEHNENEFNVVYENSQARERTQILMDYANKIGALVIGTGDLSELALGWATYNGDHMSMYAINSSIPKTLIKYIVNYAKTEFEKDGISQCLEDILNTPVSPELLPPKEGEINQKTEELVGPYELHDFYLFYAIRFSFPPKKVLRLAKYAFDYDDDVLVYWLKAFYRRFFAQQFKRSCMPDGPKIGTVSLSPRTDWRMPSDASARIWLDELENL